MILGKAPELFETGTKTLEDYLVVLHETVWVNTPTHCL